MAKGEEFTITKHGKPIARLVPISITQSKPEVRQAIEELKAFSKCNTVGDGFGVRETTNYASIKQRLEHVETLGKTALLEAAEAGSVAGSRGRLAGRGTVALLGRGPPSLDSAREGMT